MTGILAGMLLFTAGIAAAERFRRRRMYRMVSRMLEQVLNREKIGISDIREGGLSALAGKMIRVQETLEYEVDQAQKEKEQVKSLISNMSHQLKTPLSNVVMYRELLETEPDAEQRADFLERMRLQLDKINWILQSLFKMVKLEQDVIRFETEQASLKETLVSALSSVYEKAEKKEIRIVTEPFPDCLLEHNPKWTAEVFVNILENAVKYSENGSRIEIQVRPLELFTEIRFQDHGIGLYLSRMILDKEKGYMTVASEYGRGSCISVFLQNCQN